MDTEYELVAFDHRGNFVGASHIYSLEHIHTMIEFVMHHTMYGRVVRVTSKQADELWQQFNEDHGLDQDGV